MNELLIAVIGTIVATLLIHEGSAWFPRICSGLIDLAVKRLPKSQRQRYAEEWRGHINLVPGTVMKIWDAVGFVAGADTMFPRWQRSVAYRRGMARTRIANRVTIRLLDVTFAGILLLIMAPLLAMVSLFNCISGPALFRTQVKAPDGTLILVLKFRTFRVNDAGDIEVTAFGRFMRRTSLDQLPQLISVLRGHMSMITAEKAGIIPAESSLPDFRARQTPIRMARAYLRTICKISWQVMTGRI